jgi:hypothetical protein
MAGPNILFSLKLRADWDDRVLFIARTCFWWVYCMVALGTFAVMGSRQLQAASQRSKEAGAIPLPVRTPLQPGALAVVVAGTHLALFSWMVRLAWRAEDQLAAGTIAGLMVLLGIQAFFNARGRTGAALAQTANAHLAVCGTLLLAIFNVRLDVWVASAYGVSVSEIHRLLPLWIVPVLSLVFVILSRVVTALTKPKRKVVSADYNPR